MLLIQPSTSVRLDISTFVAENVIDVSSSLFEVLKYSRAVSSEAGLMSAMQTVPPRLAMSLAVARPMPLAPPVMAITFPLNDMADISIGKRAKVRCLCK